MHADLEWVLNSPSLMKPPSGAVDLSRLISTSIATEKKALISPIATTHKLGYYYEDLVNYILKKYTYPNDLKRNIRVFENKKTLGEFDFIGRTIEGDFHLECAVKFYLRVGSGDQLSHYIGPGKRDRLDIKWQRLLAHQLPLSTTPEGISACKVEGLSPQIHALQVQGYLFHPFDEGVPDELAEEINPDHLQGWWLRYNEIAKLEDRQLFIELHKPYWLTPHTENPMSVSELQVILEQKTSPTLISRGHYIGDQWQEKDRGFVVPNDW